VWNFNIGAYQVCEKWLKDRKRRKLSDDDIAHYQKVVVALAETIRLMQEIDEVIEQHGGWQGAVRARRSRDRGDCGQAQRRAASSAAAKDSGVLASGGPIALAESGGT
jgi:hypothetical protein